MKPAVALAMLQREGRWLLQLRDDIMRHKRVKTAETKGWFIKQNVSLMVGVSKLGGK